MTTGEEDHDPLERALIESLEKDEEVPLDLYTACLIGDFITVRQLIQSGSELDRKNKNGGWTPLMYAAYVGRDTIVNLLLEAGADVKIGTPKTGTTALMLASACGNESIAYFLLQQGACVNKRDRKGQTALFHAVEGGHINVVKLLLDCEADIESRQSQTHLTPLMVAAIEGHAVIFSMLIEYGADLNAKSQFGETAVSLAHSFGNITIINIVENMCQKTDTANLRGEPGLFASDSGIRDGPEKIARLAREARAAASLENKNQNVRGRDMVAPIDARDYEPVEASWSHSEFSALENEMAHMALGDKNSGTEKPTSSDNGIKGDISQTIVIPSRKKRVSRICYEPPKHQVWSPSQDQGKTNPESLAEVLETLKLSKYYPCFEKEDIDMDTFLTLTDEELKHIGIDKLGPRKKLITFISKNSKQRNNDEAGNTDGEQATNADAETAIQQAHAYVEYLQAQVYTEKQGRHELESYFVAERGRLDQIHKSSKQIKNTLNEILSLVESLRTNGKTTSEHLNSLYKDLSSGQKAARKLVEELLEMQGQLLNVSSKIASHISFSFRTNQFVIGLCTKDHSVES